MVTVFSLESRIKDRFKAQGEPGYEFIIDFQLDSKRDLPLLKETFKNIPPSKPTRRKTEIIEKTRKNCNNYVDCVICLIPEEGEEYSEYLLIRKKIKDRNKSLCFYSSLYTYILLYKDEEYNHITATTDYSGDYIKETYTIKNLQEEETQKTLAIINIQLMEYFGKDTSNYKTMEITFVFQK
jgi:hypothetical protein